jgi:peptidoglycan/LPS O-acetylase OafA/YrhL
MSLLYTIIGLFALGAILGMYLLALVIKDIATPRSTTFIHSLFVAIAFVLLVIYTRMNTPEPIDSLILFCIAAMGGIVLVYRDLTGKRVPKWLALSHGMVALGGFVFLFVFAFNA